MGEGRVKNTQHMTRGKLVLIGGLSMILVAVCVRLVRPNPDAGFAASPPPTPAGAADAPSPAPLALNVIAWPRRAARDPFRSTKVYPPQAARVGVPATAPATPPPVNVAALAREAIHLKGTVQGDRAVAMVNGRVYRAGQTIEGFRIVEITKRTITVEKGGVRVVVEPD
jgi:hypothetical protein